MLTNRLSASRRIFITVMRVLLVLAEGEAVSFEDLFQLVGSVAWERLLTRDAAIHVSGKCVRSRLMSVRDCQAVSKKAIVRRLMEQLGVSRLPETDVLVNNAGICHYGLLSQITQAQWDRLFAVNVGGIYHCVNAVLPAMLRSASLMISSTGSVPSILETASAASLWL